MLEDLRYALRTLRNAPGFTLVAVLSIALGLGANITVFSWIQNILINPLPGIKDGSHIWSLETVAADGHLINSSYPDYRDFRDQAKNLDGVLAFWDRAMSIGDDERSQRVFGCMVSGNFFDVLGVKPALGRSFLPEEQAEKPDAFPVVVISHSLWKSYFHGDTRIIGQTVKVNRLNLTVIGVAPPGFRGPEGGLAFDLFIPVMMQPAMGRSGNPMPWRSTRPFHLLARVKPGVSVAQAQAELDGITRQLQASYPRSNQGLNARLLPVWKASYGAQSALSNLLLILMAVAAVVLLIVCANVANLLLARAASRQKEISVRLALGASRLRLIRQLLMESVVLALMGGCIGVLFTAWLVGALEAFAPVTDLPLTLAGGINLPVLGFSLALALVASLLFGLAPALATTRPGLLEWLKEGNRSSTGSLRTHRLRGVLVISEVALALVSVIGAGLLAQSFRNARQIHPGFDADRVLLAGMNLSLHGYDRDRGLDLLRRLQERLEHAPGVKEVAYGEMVPLGLDLGPWEETQVDGYQPPPGEDMKIHRNIISPGYFSLLRIPMVAGRDFNDQDGVRGSPFHAIVNETFAQRYFAGHNPLGRHMRFWGQDWTVVGVAADIKYHSINESPMPYFYVPMGRVYVADTGIALHLRTAGPPAQFVSLVRRELQSLDPAVTLFYVPMKEYSGAAYIVYRIASVFLSILGTLSLVLAALGLYGVLAYSVSQRTREIGIRMAMGARPAQVFRLVVGQGMRLVLVGLALGVIAALAATRGLVELLVGVRPADPFTFAAGALMLTLVGLLAGYWPARRATRVDPMVALRYE